MVKIAKTFRLEETTIETMNSLMSYYQKKLGIKISQADLLTILMKNDYNRIVGSGEQGDLFNVID